ncbi:autophagy-related protein 13b [Syzygium oleosum]|uniref:autophagy-related protein 13b n=1 Tax=Syzygium oleosum TaxID=219896 RepID=UPI0011D295DC|nr:autophagy-related protein 13b [Syzygium oleosum]XP_056168433.1 autophagy-related protein 13b [Syzygium oleosum]
MASSHSDSAKMEQIITEFYAKSLHIILESRTPYISSRNLSGEQTMSSPSSSSSSSSSVRSRDKWFNLALRECPEALENLDLWRQSNLEPMVVDVVLVKRAINWDPANFYPKTELFKNLSSKEPHSNCWNSDQEELGNGRSEKIIERWTVQYEVRKAKGAGKGSKRSSSNILSFYNKLMLLLRSVYLTVRLLPAYKIFRDLNLTGQIRSFSLAHRVSSFVEPFTRREEAEMQRFVFAPVDTSSGRLCLSVLYRSSLSDVSSGASTPMSPQVIPDYVGSPLADPLKRFPSLPVSCGSPSSLPFSRRHSWSFDQYRASPPSVTFLPSPTHSEPYASASNPSSRRFLPPGLPPHPPEVSHAHKDNASFDEYYPSPTFSPSPSPSPPIFVPGSHLSRDLLRSESAPVNILATKFLNSPTLFKNQNLPPSPPLRGTRYGPSMANKSTCPSRDGATVDKMSSVGRDDMGRYSGSKISSGNSAHISYSRSSCRSFHDDSDEYEYTCPFDVEDDDVTDPGSRADLFDKRRHAHDPLQSGSFLPIRKSPGAAVGALVDMLKKAPPLHQDFSNLATASQASRSETWSNSFHEHCQTPKAISAQDGTSSVASSALLASKTTTDALEELKVYREMRNLLLSQGGTGRSQSLPNNAAAAAVESAGRGTVKF